MLLLAAASSATGLPTDTWLGFGVASPLVVVLMGLLVYERKRADAERQRAAEAHDLLIAITREVVGGVVEQTATYRTVATALDGLTRAVERVGPRP